MARVAFVQNLAVEYLGVMSLSALLKKHGHVVEVFIVESREASLRELARFQPAVIGFPCSTGTHDWVVAFAAALKKRMDGTVIIGGPHATFFPEIIKEPPVDLVCVGEGEQAVLELAGRVDERGDLTTIPNLWAKRDDAVIRNDPRDLISDLDALPFPDRELYAGKYPYLNRSHKVFMAGRGCPFDCTYCFNHAYMNIYRGKGRMVRLRSVDNLISEIRLVMERHRVSTVYMQDDTFTLNKAWLREFCDTYRREIGRPFICLVRADLADEEAVGLLAEAGCRRVFFGVETGSEAMRADILKKRITDEQIVELAGLLRRHGIRFRTYNMLGLPGETIDQALQTVRINQRIRTDFPWCSLFHPYLGTELAEYSKQQGFLEPGTSIGVPSFFKESVLRSECRHELENLQKLFFYAVRFPRLELLIRRLIRVRPNALFHLAFLMAYAWSYMRSERLTLRDVLSTGLRNVRRFYFASDSG